MVAFWQWMEKIREEAERTAEASKKLHAPEFKWSPTQPEYDIMVAFWAKMKSIREEAERIAEITGAPEFKWTPGVVGGGAPEIDYSALGWEKIDKWVRERKRQMQAALQLEVPAWKWEAGGLGVGPMEEALKRVGKFRDEFRRVQQYLREQQITETERMMDNWRMYFSQVFGLHEMSNEEIEGLWSTLSESQLERLTEMYEAWDEWLNGFLTGMKEAVSAALLAGEGIQGVFQRLGNFILDYFVGTVIRTMIDELYKALALKEALGGFFSGFWSWLLPFGGGGTLVKAFQHGGTFPEVDTRTAGTVNRATILPMAGERGPEAFVPLEGGSIPVTIRGGGSGVSIGNIDVGITVYAESIRDLYDRNRAEFEDTIADAVSEGIRRGAVAATKLEVRR